ncbi:FkbM family methyltransferase [Labrenzia sp. EL_126]|nr:FkbM family methyltransferase [Labrenzia sp. EL_126]
MLKKTLRTAQTFFPWGVNLKHKMMNAYYWVTKKPFEPEFNFLRQFDFPPNECFIDVGSNRGQSIAAMMLFHQNVEIVAFEPRRSTYSLLQAFAKDFDNVKILNEGLGTEKGSCTLYTPSYRGYVFDGLSSTVFEEAEGWLNPQRIYFFDPSKLTVQTEEIFISTLDAYDLNPAFMKIDVQGAEESVLSGAANTIAKSKPVIMIELSPEKDFLKVLEKYGYGQYHFDENGLREGIEGANNGIFIPEERKTQLKAIRI